MKSQQNFAFIGQGAQSLHDLLHRQDPTEFPPTASSNSAPNEVGTTGAMQAAPRDRHTLKGLQDRLQWQVADVYHVCSFLAPLVEGNKGDISCALKYLF